MVEPLDVRAKETVYLQNIEAEQLTSQMHTSVSDFLEKTKMSVNRQLTKRNHSRTCFRVTWATYVH